MKRLIRALKRYALFEEYIVSYGFDDFGSRDKLDFYFQTRNSNEGDFHLVTISDIPKRVSDNDIDNAIKTIYNKVRELEKRGE